MSHESPQVGFELDQWQVNLSRDWDVLGPFPIHAREQHFLSPGFPLILTSPYHHEDDRKWPSSLSENAEVTWQKVRANTEGNLAVSFPKIRWSKIRATEGWAGLQHHSVLHTLLSVHPPRTGRTHRVPRIRVQLNRGSFFAILSRQTPDLHPVWHAGNIYAMNRSPPNTVELPGEVYTDKPSVFDLFVSGDYEIRLFGDPRDNGEETPTLRVNVAVGLEGKRKAIVRQESHDVICDFVDGIAFGDALGVGLRSIDGWWDVERLEAFKESTQNVTLSISHKQVIAPSQTRVVPILIEQVEAYTEEDISFNIILKEHLDRGSRSNLTTISVPVTIALRHLRLWEPSRWDAIRATFFFASSHPAYFIAKPPIEPSKDGRSVPIFALHGAGVDIIESTFWADAVPRQEFSWIVLPVGRTEWGLDWHGPSSSEAWEALTALTRILSRNENWKRWSFASNSRVLILGHSNGGQGAWYLASRYPDRTQALLAAAGYLSAAEYVSLSQARGARFVDPGLRAVLESSFITDDNALFVGNLADSVPVLAVHGGEDTNVPTWHSREYVSIIRSWGKGLNVSFHVDDGQPHWYPNVFESEQVRSFLEKALHPEKHATSEAEFTLTVADTTRSGSLHGFKITELLTPGRLARLRVQVLPDGTHVSTVNVRTFTVDFHIDRIREPMTIDGLRLPFVPSTHAPRQRRISISRPGTWVEVDEDLTGPSAPPGRVQNLFDTSGPITIVIPSDSNVHEVALSAALRIAQFLDVYLKLDSEILVDTYTVQFPDATQMEPEDARSRAQGNLIVIGGSKNALTRKFLQRDYSDLHTEFGLSESGRWLFRNRPIRDEHKDVGILFTHPHPTNPLGTSVFLAAPSGIDSEGFERVLHLFVPRTGIAVPDWIVVGEDMDARGAGGVIGAGVWNSAWKWHEAVSYMP